jgi:hypothetical protein
MPKRLSKIDPLDIDELFQSPSLEGMLSFREVDPTMAALRLQAPQHPAPIGVTPTGLTPTGVAPVRSEPIGETGPGGLSAAEVLAEVEDAGRTGRSRGRIMRAVKVEDGHSGNENSLYWYLWRSGRQIRNSQSRFVQMGYALISKSVDLDRTNIQNILRSLETKLAIRVVTPGTVKSSTVYEVLSCEQILAVRRDAGFVWVRRYGSRRADFVDEAGNLLPPIGVTPTGLAPIGVTPLGDVGDPAVNP